MVNQMRKATVDPEFIAVHGIPDIALPDGWSVETAINRRGFPRLGLSDGTRVVGFIEKWRQGGDEAWSAYWMQRYDGGNSLPRHLAACADAQDAADLVAANAPVGGAVMGGAA